MKEAKWNFLPHQIEMADEAEKILRKYALVYIAAMERVGKSGTVINLVERLRPHFILIVTKKRAIDGWQEHIKNLPTTKNYTVTNYEQVGKLPLGKFELIVVDEAHSNLSMYPKPGKRWKDLEKLCRNKIIVYLSATPSATSLSQLYNQFALSSWGPWRDYPSFYRWYEDGYGKPKSKFISGRTIIDYTETHEDKIRADTNHLFVTMTRQEVGFEHEPTDELHYVKLHPKVVELQKLISKDRYVPEGHSVMKNKNELVLDSPGKHLSVLHQIAGGTVKIDDFESITLDYEYQAKIQYILKKFGDSEKNVIFYNYKQELILLEKYFKKTRILQGTSYAEGISLMEYDTLIVYSQDFSTARYSQRRARQCNLYRKDEIIVHYILDEGISKQAYETVAEKKANFVDSYFNGV